MVKITVKGITGKFRLSLRIIKEIRNWPTIFLNYFGILNQKKIRYSFRNGQKFFLRNIEDKKDTSGIATVYEIFLIENYNPSFMKIKPGDTVVDIGANMGIFSIYASLNSKNGKVYSYEALREHFERMQKNVEINNFKNIKTENFAIAGKKGKKRLFINKNCSGGHSLVFDRDSEESLIVDCITLRDIFDRNKIEKIDFLKIDCEGAEYEILYSIPDKYFKKISKISLEFENSGEKNCNSGALRKFLEGKGFIVNIKGEGLKEGILYAYRT